MEPACGAPFPLIGAGGPRAPYYLSPAPDAGGSGWCALLGLLCLALVLTWLWAQRPACAVGPRRRAAPDLPYYGAALRGAPDLSHHAAALRGAPDANSAPLGAARSLDEPRSGSVSDALPQIPVGVDSPRLSGALVGGNQGGTSLDLDTYTPSQTTSEFYSVFKPVALEATMPMGWRATGPSEKPDDTNIYNEFSRYAISPNQMKRAENMRSVLRLGESSRDGLSRTLGQRSILRDFITPLGPNPIGDKAMLWNDSSVRQNYIASTTGKFPEVSENC